LPLRLPSPEVRGPQARRRAVDLVDLDANEAAGPAGTAPRGMLPPRPIRQGKPPPWRAAGGT
jgi:hypothetical protein